MGYFLPDCSIFSKQSDISDRGLRGLELELPLFCGLRLSFWSVASCGGEVLLRWTVLSRSMVCYAIL